MGQGGWPPVSIALPPGLRRRATAFPPHPALREPRQDRGLSKCLFGRKGQCRRFPQQLDHLNAGAPGHTSAHFVARLVNAADQGAVPCHAKPARARNHLGFDPLHRQPHNEDHNR